MPVASSALTELCLGRTRGEGSALLPSNHGYLPSPYAMSHKKGLGTWGKEKKHMIKFWEKGCAGNTGVLACGQGVGVLGVDSSCPDLSFVVVQEGSCQIGIIAVKFSHL